MTAQQIDVHGLPAKWRAEADDCDDKAREREAENARNGQWFRGCANGHRLAAAELDDALRQSGEAVATHQMILAGIGTLRKSDGKTPVLHYNEVADLYEAMRKAASPATSGLVEALQKLVEAADDSDGAQYGTLSTSFVRDIALAALAAHNARGGK